MTYLPKRGIKPATRIEYAEDIDHAHRSTSKICYDQIHNLNMMVLLQADDDFEDKALAMK
jgi:hypothetical protein